MAILPPEFFILLQRKIKTTGRARLMSLKKINIEPEEMLAAAEALEFERAADLRDKIKRLSADNEH